MNSLDGGQVLSLVSLAGWLLLVAAGFAAYRVSAAKAVRMALVWAAVFLGGFALVRWFGLG